MNLQGLRDIRLGFADGVDSVGDVHRVALERSQPDRGGLMAGQRVLHSFEHGLAEGIVLINHSDLVGSPDLPQVVHLLAGFFKIGGRTVTM